MTRTLLALAPLLLTGCPDYEGPIDVILVDLDDTAVVTWAEQGSDAFEVCANATTDPEATVGCGPHGVGEPGTYVVRVSWSDMTAEKTTAIEDDRDYQANTVLRFSTADFAVDGADSAR